MNYGNEKSKIIIKTGNNEDLIELQMCASEFIEFIDDFEINLQNEKYFILTAYYLKSLTGVLLSENNSSKVDDLEKIVPKVKLIFLFVNSAHRNNKIASILLKNYVKIQKERKMAAIFIKLPQKYKFGKKFLEKFNFVQIKTTNNDVILERTLWYDFGIDSYDFSNNRQEFMLNRD